MKNSSTTEKVLRTTSDKVNRGILAQTEANIRYYATHPEMISDRLQELDNEWDIERVLEANASALSLGGIFLGLFRKRFLWISATAMYFLHQHAHEGWCPPLFVFRRWGVRTRTEIEYERYALKMIRGDFVGTRRGNRRIVEKVLDAALPEVLTPLK
ncbi:hypothetical protein P3T73_02670 [Kiritimatiellota bacterium B12222]|nr:hypothetical protein P3T73_02670 [Kiritimatiellota bacterium B12222]